MRRRSWLAAVGAVVALWAAESIPATALTADAADRQELQTAANDLEQRLLHCGCTYEHPELDAYLQGVAERLLATDPTAPPGPVRIRALKSPEANAFALPNGAIFINTALLQSLDSEAQLATVLGHELTHYTHSHALQESHRAQHTSVWTHAIALVFAAGLAAISRDPQVAALAADLSSKSADLWYLTSVSGYSRTLEREADTEGLRRMVTAGYDASEGVVAFERLAAATHDDGKGNKPFFASHPRLTERIASYRELIGSEYAGAVGSDRRVGREEYRSHTPGLALDQVQVLLAAKQYERADAVLTAELDQGETARARFLQGEIARGRFRTADGENQALTAYQRAAQLPDPPPDALRQAALIHRGRGDEADARREFQRYLELAPNAEDAPLVRAYLGDGATPVAEPSPPPPPEKTE
jgi:beta-barrel assembly-enhancing protease